jgi:hypothetical protein
MILTCPKCGDAVLVPSSTNPSAVVRCPLCRESYALTEALERLPPVLQVVEPGHPEPGNPFGLGAVAIASSPAAPGQTLMELAEDSTTPAGVNDWDPASAELPEPFDLPAGPAASPRLKTSTRPKRKEKSAVAEMLKVVLGGVAGLTCTQVLLWWGFHNDPFDLARTLGANKLTSWIVPQIYRAAAAGAPGPAAVASTTPAAGSGSDAAPGNNGFNSKVNWDAVLSGKPESKPSKAKTGNANPLMEDAPLQADFDLPGSKPADPLAIDLTDPLAAPTAKPATPSPEPTLDLNPIDPAKPQPKPATPDEPTPSTPDESPSKPAEKPAEKPTEKPVTEPAEKPAEKPSEKPAETPADKPAAEPKPESKPEPKTEPAGEPASKPAEPTAAVLRTVAAARTANQQWRDTTGGEKDVRRKAAESLVAVLIDLAGDVQRVDAAAPEAAAALDAVGTLAKELSTEAGTTKVVEVLTAGNMDAAERKSPAIALVGAVKATAKEGDFFVTEMQLGDKDKRTVRVLSPADPGFAAETKVLVIGDLTDTKAQPIEGYSGEPGVVVVTRHRGFVWAP